MFLRVEKEHIQNWGVVRGSETYKLPFKRIVVYNRSIETSINSENSMNLEEPLLENEVVKQKNVNVYVKNRINGKEIQDSIKEFRKEFEEFLKNDKFPV